MLERSCPRYIVWLLATLLFAADFTDSTVWSQPPAPAAAPAEDPQKQHIRSLLQQAEEQLRLQSWDSAFQICTQVIDLDPKATRAFALRAQSLVGKGDYETALREVDMALQQPSRDPESMLGRADAYTAQSMIHYERKAWLPAIDSAYLATLEKSDHPTAHYHRGRAYVARGDTDKAINSLNRALQINPKLADAYSLRGFAYGTKGNFDQAISDQGKAIELDPQSAIAYQRRGAAYALKKDFEKAIVDIEQALKLKPDMAEALCDRAILFALRRDVARATADLDAAIRANPQLGRAHLLKGNALLAQGDEAGALQAFTAALTCGESPEAYLARANLLVKQRDFEAAAEDYTRIIALAPKTVIAYQGRAQCYRKLGRNDDALVDLASVRELQPKTPAKKDQPDAPETLPRFIVQSKGVNPDLSSRVEISSRHIDRLVAANYAKYGVKPNPLTSDSQFVRRVYLDVTGTIPTFQQASLFIKSTDPDKRKKLIDELLASEGYSSHFFNYWADILRYKDQLNGNVRGEPYRQWLKQSLAENKPWDRFVYEMLTAEGLIWKNPATGYLQRDPGMPLDGINNTVRIFLGTRIGCAQCHNHPFDRWTQKEFYQIAAFMYGTVQNTGGQDKRYWNADPNDRLHDEYAEIEQEEEERRQNSYRFDRMIGINMTIVNDQLDRKVSLPANYAYSDGKPGEVMEPKTLFGPDADLRPGEAPRRAFARWVVSKENPRFALTIANRLWKQLFGRGQIEPVDDMMDDTEAENPELMKFLELEMKRLNFDMKEYLRVLLNTETYQREAFTGNLTASDAYHFPGPVLRRMTAEQVWDSFITLAVNPVEYREPPATLRTSIMALDLTSVSAKDVLDAERNASSIDGQNSQRQAPYKYQGELLARASELPSPVPANHFLRMFGQSDRELISASSTNGSVPQILLMFNGPISHMILERNSTIYKNIVRRSSVSGGVKSLFLTILSREPNEEELKIAIAEVERNGAPGYGNVVWSLVNTREFLFIQ